MKENKPIAQISVDAQILAKHLASVPEGVLVKYETLNELIKADVQNGARNILQTARRVVQREENIVFECVKNEGIKRLHPAEIISTGKATIVKIRKTAKRGASKLACADFDRLTKEEKSEFLASTSILGAIHVCAKDRQLKAVTEAVEKQQDKLSFNATLALFKP